MLQQFDAIYENGVLRPLVPLTLDEHQQVRVSVVSAPSESNARAEAQRRAINELDTTLASIPDRSPEDGFTAADHDRALYGGSK